MLRPLVSHLPEWITAHPSLWAALGLLFPSATAVTWHLGGFETAPLEPLPTFTAGATITTNEWTLEPLCAWIADTDPTGMPAASGGALLMLEMRLGNRTQRSTALYYEALRLANAGPGLDEPWREAGWTNAQPLGVLGLAVEDRRRPSAATNQP